MTQTSSFGTSKREGHDSSSFYERNLYSLFFREPASAKELAVPMPGLDGWVDDVYRQSSTAMTQIPDNSVALAFRYHPITLVKIMMTIWALMSIYR